MRVSNGNVNTSKILNKMCNSQKTSAESLWVNTIEYLTVSNHATLDHGKIVLTESSMYKYYIKYLLV